MNWQRHYDALIERAKGRKLSGYVERHHVLPRCMGGTDEPGNIVELTAEEHFIAHQLLVKIYPGNHRLLWALSAMTNRTTNQARSNKRYGWLRRRFAAMLSERGRGRKASPETRAKLSAAKLGTKRGQFSDEHRAKLSAAAKGRKKSEAHCSAISAAKIGKTPNRGAEWKRNHANAMKRCAATKDYSYLQTKEYQAAQSERMKKWWADRRTTEEV